MSVTEITAHAKWSRFDRLDERARSEVDVLISRTDDLRQLRAAKAELEASRAQTDALQTRYNNLYARAFL